MSIAIVARFLDPVEAEIAAGALRSAGFDAVAMDQHFAAVDPLARQSLGGMRVGVPAAEAEDAASYLKDLVKARPETETGIEPGVGWRFGAAAAGILAPVFGWLVVGMASGRGRPRPALPYFLLALAFALVLAAPFGIGRIIAWLPHLLYPNGRT